MRLWLCLMLGVVVVEKSQADNSYGYNYLSEEDKPVSDEVNNLIDALDVKQEDNVLMDGINNDGFIDYDGIDPLENSKDDTNVDELDKSDKNELDLTNDETNDETGENDKIVLNDIEEYRKGLETSGEDFDYQVEDNRFEIKEKNDLIDVKSNDLDNNNENQEESNASLKDLETLDSQIVEDILSESDESIIAESNEDIDNLKESGTVEEQNSDDSSVIEAEKSIETILNEQTNSKESKTVEDINSAESVSNESVIADDVDTISKENVDEDDETKLDNSDANDISSESKKVDSDDNLNSAVAVEDSDSKVNKIENSVEVDADADDSFIIRNSDNSEDSDSIISEEVADSIEKVDFVKPSDNDNVLQDDFVDVNEFDNYFNYDDDTVDKAKADLDDDIKNLFEVWDKLSKDSNDNDEIKYEDLAKEFKPIKNYEDIDDASDNIDDIENLDETLKEPDTDSSESSDKEAEVDAMYRLLAQKPEQENSKPESQPEISYDDDVILHRNPIDFILDENVQIFEQKSDQIVEPSSEDQGDKSVNGINEEDEQLTSNEYNEKMQDFVEKHKDELDVKSENFNLDAAPIHMALSADKVVEITSPNYPDNYPTNNVIDWILEGNGIGIELNISTLALRGAANDYLLIIPGGQNTNDTNGLVFSWHLNSPRLYRFFEVNSVFIRFVTGGGMLGMSGFRMTVKNILPPPSEQDEDLPHPEPVKPTPVDLMWVNLGGLNVTEFQNVREEFRRLVADMATIYINANGIDMGVNTTQEVTQIVNVTVCNIAWPNHQDCVAVRFAVPLVYEDPEDSEEEMEQRLNEQDLMVMWAVYVYQDPFATRLRRMGITSFAIPNDSRVTMAWVILTLSVVITMAALAYALWRYNCFQNYTRMSEYSDTDSMYKKKHLDDLYPTPHQTLPPLFPEDNLDDTTRVDMGGLANRSYVYDPYDSDDEIRSQQHRQSNGRGDAFA